MVLEFLATKVDWSVEEVVGSTCQKLAMIYFTQQDVEKVQRVGEPTVRRVLHVYKQLNYSETLQTKSAICSDKFLALAKRLPTLRN